MKVLCYIFVAAVCGGATAQASTVLSFEGTFLGDDNIQLFAVDLGPNSSLTVKTFGYAGGTNGNGMVIPSGGFDPALALFDPSGNLIEVNDDAPCGIVNKDPVTGACFDAFISQPDLTTPGIYTVALTESPNLAQDNLGQPDTFPYPPGTGNFTCALYGGASASSPFCDITGDQRNGNWALDISGSNLISATTTPEPAFFVPLLAGITILVVLRRKAPASKTTASMG
jgi:hypothetical protein